MDKNKLNNYKIKILDNSNNKSKKWDILAKVEIVGDCQVGKSSITKKLSKNIFISEYIPTTQYNIFPFQIKINDTIIKFQLFDMCAKEYNRPALFNLYRNANIGILVYSITDYNSFKNLDNWITQMRQNASDNNKIILLGNKADEEDKREVSYKEGEQICQKYNLELFMEVSAKNGFTSPNFLEIASVYIYEDYLTQDKADTSLMNNSESIIISQTFSRNKNLGCCF